MSAALLVAALMADAGAARARLVPDPARPTFALRFGAQFFSADYIGPYVGGGTLIGGHGGVTFNRYFAAIALYEHGFHAPSERNPSLTASMDLLAAGFRCTPTPESVGLYMELTFGARRVAYGFYSEETQGWDKYSVGGTRERAVLWGYELRPLVGIGATPRRGIAVHLALALGIGELRTYADSLDCRTLRAPACRARFSFHTTAIVAGLRWN